MKKLFIIMLLCVSFIVTQKTFASSCDELNGASIYGYSTSTRDWTTFIGKITNEYDSNSIVNKLGTYGSNLSMNSIHNTLGTYGSSLGSYSAFNNMASYPPKVFTTNNKRGYLTINSWKTPNISPYTALSCATSYSSYSNSSFTSSNLDYSILGIERMKYEAERQAWLDEYQIYKDKFEVIKDNILTPLIQAEMQIYQNDLSCKQQYGTNSYGSGNYCYCNDGYNRNTDRTSCIKLLTPDENCKQQYGNNSKEGDPGYCTCQEGYVRNSSMTNCIYNVTYINEEKNDEELEKEKLLAPKIELFKNLVIQILESNENSKSILSNIFRNCSTTHKDIDMKYICNSLSDWLLTL